MAGCVAGAWPEGQPGGAWTRREGQQQPPPAWGATRHRPGGAGEP